MHDPMTVAFEIKSPFKNSRGYKKTWITIWHVDPEKDGTDDSCGWSRPNLTKKELELIKRETEFEMKYWFDETPFGLSPKTSAETITYAAFQMLAWRLFRLQIKTQWLPEIMSMTFNPHDNFSDGFRSKQLKTDDVVRSCYFIARAIKRLNRRWYQHPRWHFKHWKINIHFLQSFKRWAFSRCCYCGKGFSWGYCPISNQWHGSGPQWFKSEKSVYHDGCEKVARA